MLKRLFPKSEFSKNIFTLTSGTALAQVIPFIVTPILSRIYTPAEFGVFATFMSGVLVLSVLATGRYEMAVVIAEKKEDAINLLALSVTLILTLCILVAIALPLLKTPLAYWMKGNDVLDWLYLYPVAIACNSLSLVMSYWNNRKKKYKRLSYNKIGQSVATAGYKLSYGLVKVSAFGLIMGNIFGFFYSTVILFIQFVKEDLYLLKAINLRSIKELARRYSKFPKYDVFTGMINTFSTQVPIIMLSFYFTPVIVGWYSIAHTVLRLPMTFVGVSIGQVYFQHASELKEDRERLKNTTFGLYKKLLYLGIIPMAVIGGFGDIIFRIFLGEEWTEAGIYARILSPWLLAVFMASPISFLMNVLEKQQLNLTFNIVVIILRVIVVAIGGLYFKDAAITVALFGGISFIFWQFLSLKLLNLAGISYRKSIIFTFPLLIVGASFIVLLRFLIDALI